MVYTNSVLAGCLSDMVWRCLQKWAAIATNNFKVRGRHMWSCTMSQGYIASRNSWVRTGLTPGPRTWACSNTHKCLPAKVWGIWSPTYDMAEYFTASSLIHACIPSLSHARSSVYCFTWVWVGCQEENFSPVVASETFTCELQVHSEVLSPLSDMAITWYNFEDQCVCNVVFTAFYCPIQEQYSSIYDLVDTYLSMYSTYSNFKWSALEHLYIASSFPHWSSNVFVYWNSSSISSIIDQVAEMTAWCCTEVRTCSGSHTVNRVCMFVWCACTDMIVNNTPLF